MRCVRWLCYRLNSPEKAAALAAEIHGVKKNALYKYALEQQGSKPLPPVCRVAASPYPAYTVSEPHYFPGIASNTSVSSGCSVITTAFLYSSGTVELLPYTAFRVNCERSPAGISKSLVKSGSNVAAYPTGCVSQNRFVFTP